MDRGGGEGVQGREVVQGGGVLPPPFQCIPGLGSGTIYDRTRVLGRALAVCWCVRVCTCVCGYVERGGDGYVPGDRGKPGDILQTSVREGPGPTPRPGVDALKHRGALDSGHDASDTGPPPGHSRGRA